MGSDQGPVILVVEDNPINLELMVELLEMEGYVVLTANSGEMGITLARQQQPNLILMDISLPGMSGLDAVRHLRADPLTQTIPILAVTANARPADLEAALAAGCDGFVPKPIDLETMMETIRAHL